MRFSLCKHCDNDSVSQSKLCVGCEDISIERSNIIKEWMHYEGCMPPKEELPQYPTNKKEMA